MPRSVRLALAAATAAGALAAPAQGAITRTTLSGPSADTATTGGQQVAVDAAPDGSVAAAFLKTVGGQPRVFVARGTDGNLGGAVQIDTGLAQPSGTPVVGIGNGGKLFVAFPNGPANAEKLYAVTAAGTGAALSAPSEIGAPITGWKGLGLDVAANGDGYLTGYELFNLRAFRIQNGVATAVGGTGAGGKLNGNPAEQAEAGDQRGVHFAVDASGATATLAWSETNGGNYRVWARKLSGTGPGDIGTAVDPEIPALDGKPFAAGADDMTWVATGGGQTYVAFREQFTYGAQNRARLIIRSFDGTTLGAPKVLDGLPADPAEGAEYPRFAINASGQGLAASYRQLTFTTEFATKPAGGDWSTGSAVPGFPTTATPGMATAAITDSGAGLIAASNGAVGATQLVSRVVGGAQDGTVAPISDAAAGAVTAFSPAAAASSFALVAYRQGAAATSRVEVAKVDLPSTPAPTPTPTPTPTGGGTTPVFPNLTRVRLSSSSIKRANKRPIVLTSAAKGPWLQFTVDRSARITIWAERVLAGRRGAKGCERPKAANRTGKRCTRYVAVSSPALILDRPPGTTKVRFTGRLGGKLPLAKGRYRLNLTAADAATGGLTIPPARVRVTLR